MATEVLTARAKLAPRRNVAIALEMIVALATLTYAALVISANTQPIDSAPILFLGLMLTVIFFLAQKVYDPMPGVYGPSTPPVEVPLAVQRYELGYYEGMKADPKAFDDADYLRGYSEGAAGLGKRFKREATAATA